MARPEGLPVPDDGVPISSLKKHKNPLCANSETNLEIPEISIAVQRGFEQESVCRRAELCCTGNLLKISVPGL